MKAAEGCFTKFDNVCESGLEYVTECASVCVCVHVRTCAHTYIQFKYIHMYLN